MANISVVRALYSSIGAVGLALVVFVVAARNPWTALAGSFAIGAAALSIAPALQTRLMDVAHCAQTLAAALNQAARNVANASGAWLGGVVICSRLRLYIARGCGGGTGGRGPRCPRGVCADSTPRRTT